MECEIEGDLEPGIETFVRIMISDYGPTVSNWVMWFILSVHVQFVYNKVVALCFE